MTIGMEEVIQSVLNLSQQSVVAIVWVMGSGAVEHAARSTVGFLPLALMVALNSGEGPAKHSSTTWLMVSAHYMPRAVVFVTPHEPNTVAVPKPLHS